MDTKNLTNQKRLIPIRHDADVRMSYCELELGAVTSRGYTSDFAKETRVGMRNVTGQKS